MSTYRCLNMYNIYFNTTTLFFFISGPFGLGRLSFSGSLSLELDIDSTDLSWSLFINLVWMVPWEVGYIPSKIPTSDSKWSLELLPVMSRRVGAIALQAPHCSLSFPWCFFVCIINWLLEMVPVVLCHVPYVWGSGYSHGSYLDIGRVFGDAWSQFWQFKLEEVRLTAVVTQWLEARMFLDWVGDIESQHPEEPMSNVSNVWEALL